MGRQKNGVVLASPESGIGCAYTMAGACMVSGDAGRALGGWCSGQVREGFGCVRERMRVRVGMRSGGRGGIGGRCYVCGHVRQCTPMYADMCERGRGSERAGAAFGIHGKLLRIAGIIRMGL